MALFRLTRMIEPEPVLRGDGIYAVGRKSGPLKNRWPEWLYA